MMDRLPPELVARIFILRRYDDSMTAMLKPMAWTAVTHVCRGWRGIALGYPALWSDITISSRTTSWIPVMLERSAGMALDVDIGGGRLADREVIAKALSHLARLRTLKQHSTSYALISEQVKALILGLTRPAPLLEELALEELSGYNPAPLKTLPFDFLAGDTPRLRRLTLTSWKLNSWSSPLLGSTLTDLKLSFNDAVPSAGPVLDALDRMINLESLWFHVPLPDCEPPTSQLRKVNLRRLQKLSTHTVPMEQLAWLMQHMSIPVSATLDLHCTLQGDGTPPIIHSFTSTFSTAWLDDPLETSPSPPSFKHFDISFEYGEKGGAMTLLGHFEYAPRENRRFPQLYLRIDEGGTKASLANTFDNFPLENIQYLELYADLTPSEITPLARLQRLEQVHCRFAHSFVEHLTNSLKSPTEILFPSLKQLSLSGQDFTGEYLEMRDTLSVEGLIQCLKRRKEDGREVASIKLAFCCNLFKDDVRKIQEVCNEVVWDGQENKKSKADEDEYEFGGGDDDSGENGDENSEFTYLQWSSMFYDSDSSF
ncbi:hypothetical protein BKA70DRAFT_1352021 [Coprinopsis sp. MPI-PUGE-AT-0042]|nr:hypothetical protein BKA70DRAFT_1352021 [Coprinopsis sp. MPI-PUGE-AT-0042]